jgi:Beta-lactamase
MQRDAIFRIASLAKPITAVAAMILVEECKLRLDESIEPWLPELANRRVLKSISSQPDDTVPALRAITVRDLLTSRMGFGSVMAMPDTYPIQKLIREYRIGGDGPMLPSQAPGTDEWQQKLGSLPWMRSPRLLHRDLARLDGFCFWQRNGQDASVDLRAEFRRIDRWIKLVDAAEIVRLDLPIDQFSSKFGLLPMT